MRGAHSGWNQFSVEGEGHGAGIHDPVSGSCSEGRWMDDENIYPFFSLAD